MRNQLWFKLTGAFALIIFISAIVTVWLASQGAATQLEHFMVANQMVRPTAMQATLANYYSTNSGWEGVDTALDALVLGASDGMMTGMFGNMMGMPANRIQVLDAEGAVMAGLQTARAICGSPERIHGDPTPPLRAPLLARLRGENGGLLRALSLVSGERGSWTGG